MRFRRRLQALGSISRHLNRTCPRGHSGHAVDAYYCRICGAPLEGTPTDSRRLRVAEHGKPGASWTDDNWKDAPTGLLHKWAEELNAWKTPREVLIKAIEQADKPTGWRWEG